MSKTSANGLPPIRIAFIHPDLGIGGAERLVVDAAISLKRRGHSVTVFTSRHDPTRCFEETRDGTLKVHVLGSSLPRSLFNSLHVLFAIARQLLLAFLLFCSLSPLVPASLRPLPDVESFDVYFVDQLSVCVPILRWFLGTRVVFYCHFPDKLLSGGWDVSLEGVGDGPAAVPRKKQSEGLRGFLKDLYRIPVDKLEEWTTGQADVVLANSIFTSKVYKEAFKSLTNVPEVVYPGIDLAAYAPLDTKKETSLDVKLVKSDQPTILSLNRFESKKNIALAVEAFARLTKDGLVDDETFASLRLVIAGGYDPQTPDNIATLAKLKSLCSTYSLTYHVLSELSLKPPPSTQVLFILNFTTDQRTSLLLAPSTLALLYTPQNEHFGIVPVEAMACGLPVLAANSGGPRETVLDLDASTGGGTGLLRKPVGAEWASALARLVGLKEAERKAISERAKERVKDLFDLEAMGARLDQACRKAESMGGVVPLGIWAVAAMGVAGAALVWKKVF